jgi:predicted homoserine dehydrogenase-like protein
MAATKVNKKVVTMNSEFHVTAGTYFIKNGHYVTEAEGDQPGCLARLKADIENMGFDPVAYVNLKGFLNPNPELEEMKQLISEYILCEGSPPGVLIVAKNKVADMRPGYLPFTRIQTKEKLAYVLLRPYHLCY